MTLLAGMVALDGHAISDSACDALSSAIARRADSVVTSHRDERAFLLKVDYGTLGESAAVSDGEAVTFLTGEPLLQRANGAVPSRAVDTGQLHTELRADGMNALRSARGVFSLAHYSVTTGVLTLATDKLGIRPLYCWSDDRYVVFASALRVLEALALVPRRMDVRGVTEITAFGYPLAARTPYVGIELLQAGEVRHFGGDRRTRSERYWRWENVRQSGDDAASLSARLFDAFRDAIRIRLRSDRGAVAFLSGGLDSRCIVAALRMEEVNVHTFNFALPGTQDREFGARLARAAGTCHHEREVDDPVDTHWSAIMADAIDGAGADVSSSVERPRCAWSGDGGSVGFGHVYLGRNLVEQLSSGDMDAAVTAYVEHERAYVPRRLLGPELAATLTPLPRRSVREELDRIDAADAVHRFWLFLMLNDQHRHLSRHFEDLDTHGLELQLPFFDSEFLSVIASVPVGLRLYHRLYVEWLRHFPGYVRTVPWQAYPGHEPCPVPLDDSVRLAYQWDARVASARRAMRRRQIVAETRAALRARDFARPLLRRSFLTLATLLHSTGARDYHYVLDAARTYQRYWRLCGGSHELPR